MRRDWIQLKNQFVIGKWQTVANFFRDQKIKDNSRSRLHTKGWLEEKRQYQEEIVRKTRSQVIEKEVDVRVRQQKLALGLQAKGLRGLQELPIQDAKTAFRMIVSGLQEERSALGYDDKNNGIKMSQVNISLPKTRFDEIIESSSYEELVKFIATLRKLRADKSVTTVENQ